MDTLLFRTSAWLVIGVLATLLIAVSHDFGFSVHLGIVAIAAFAAMIYSAKFADYGAILSGAPGRHSDISRYDDEVIRWGVIATMFWGFAGLAAGL